MCIPKLLLLCIIIACALLRSDPVKRWQVALDKAKTAEELSALRSRIKSEMRTVSADNKELAQRFLEVIDRKAVAKPYEEEFRQVAGGR